MTLFYSPHQRETEAWQSVALTQAPTVGGVERFVYTVELPPQAADFQWYVRADMPPAAEPYTEGLGTPAGTVVTPSGVTCFVPPGGAAAPQSVVIMPA